MGRLILEPQKSILDVYKENSIFWTIPIFRFFLHLWLGFIFGPERSESISKDSNKMIKDSKPWISESV